MAMRTSLLRKKTTWEDKKVKTRKTIRTALAIIVIALISGCASSRKYEPAFRDAKTISGRYELYLEQPPIVVRPIIADLIVGQLKVTGVAVSRMETEANLKRLAILDALEKSHADVLIEPTYETVIKHEVGTNGKVHNITTVKVSGYPGIYKNFRSSNE